MLTIFLGREMPLGTRIAMREPLAHARARDRPIGRLAHHERVDQDHDGADDVSWQPQGERASDSRAGDRQLPHLSGETPASVLSHVRSVIDDPRVSITLSGEPTPPSPVSSTSSRAYRVLEREIYALEPNAIVSPSLVIGATDARAYGSFARDVYRFLPVRPGPRPSRSHHGTNERIGVHDYARGVAFMTALIAELSSQ